jgi:uncharacterized membrane protein
MPASTHHRPSERYAHRHPDPRLVPAGHCLQWLYRGWQLFAINPGTWVAMSLLMIVLLFAVGIVPIIGAIIMPMGFTLLAGGMLLGAQALDRKQPVHVKHLFAGFQRHTGNLVMVGCFYLIGGLCAALVSLVIGGSAALTSYFVGGVAAVFGGVVLATGVFSVLWVLLMTALVVLHDVAPLDAMKLSAQACFRNMGTFLLLGVLLYILVWMALLPAALGVLVLIPVIAGAVYASYLDVFPDPDELPLTVVSEA